MVHEAVAWLGGLDVVVTVVGGQVAFVPAVPLHEITDQDWDTIYELNLRYVARTLRLVIPEFLSQGSGGTVISIGSVTGSMAAPGQAAYGVMKAGLASLARTVAAEYSNKQIRMNVIAGGAIATGASGNTQGDDWVEAIPQGRFGNATEVASAALYLAGDESSYVSRPAAHRRRRRVRAWSVQLNHRRTEASNPSSPHPCAMQSSATATSMRTGRSIPPAPTARPRLQGDLGASLKHPGHTLKRNSTTSPQIPTSQQSPRAESRPAVRFWPAASERLDGVGKVSDRMTPHRAQGSPHAGAAAQHRPHIAAPHPVAPRCGHKGYWFATRCVRSAPRPARSGALHDRTGRRTPPDSRPYRTRSRRRGWRAVHSSAVHPMRCLATPQPSSVRIDGEMAAAVQLIEQGRLPRSRHSRDKNPRHDSQRTWTDRPTPRSSVRQLIR